MCDTNPLVYMLDGDALIGTFLSNKQVYLSFITELELYGKRNLSFQDKTTIEQMVDSCFVAEINPAIKQIYIELRRKYSIKLPDAIIASTAIYLICHYLLPIKVLKR